MQKYIAQVKEFFSLVKEQMATFGPSDKLRHLIQSDTSLLMVMSRSGISLGFGEKTVKEVCEEQNIDTDTFLCLANYASGRQYDSRKLSLPFLISYLKNAHSYFLDFKLPMIKRLRLRKWKKRRKNIRRIWTLVNSTISATISSSLSCSPS